MARTVLAAVFAASFLLFLDSPAVVAQGGGVSATARAGYTMLYGDFSDADAAPGLEGILRFHRPGGMDLGVGLNWSSHDVPDDDDKTKVFGVFVEPRYSFSVVGSSLTPFLGGRAGWLHQSFPAPGQSPIEISGNGFEVGATGGVSVEVAPTVRLEAAVAGMYLWVKDAEGEETNNGNFTSVTLDGASVGPALSILLGLRIGFAG